MPLNETEVVRRCTGVGAKRNAAQFFHYKKRGNRQRVWSSSHRGFALYLSEFSDSLQKLHFFFFFFFFSVYCMAANLQSRGLVSLGKRVVNQISCASARTTANSPSLSGRYGSKFDLCKCCFCSFAVLR